MQVIGFILFSVGILATLFWTLNVIYSTFGIWVTVVGGFFAPVTFIASVIIVWVSTGHFPLLLLVIYLSAWLGAALWLLGTWGAGDNDF